MMVEEKIDVRTGTVHAEERYAWKKKSKELRKKGDNPVGESAGLKFRRQS